MSYSQNNEEAVILDLMAKAGYEKIQGRFMDIGAYDGKTFSNTLHLVELGWSGVCVEPSPTAFTGLLKLHGSNSDIILVNAAVGTGNGWLDFYDSGGDAVSSSDATHVSRWQKNAGVRFTKFMLRSISIDELFTKFGTNFQFINLDVESLNLDIFRAMPWSWLKETVAICVEHDRHMKEMTEMVAPFGFKAVSENAENLILSRV